MCLPQVKSIEEGVAEIASRAFWQVAIDAEHRRMSQVTEEQRIVAAQLIQARWRARRAARMRLRRAKFKLKMAARRIAAGERPTDPEEESRSGADAGGARAITGSRSLLQRAA